MEKDNKKKTLTISSDLKKKIDTSSISTDGKKSFAVKKKEPFRGNKSANRDVKNYSPSKIADPKKKNFARKFVEQQATKAFIKKDDKPTGKSKLKLKGPIDKKDFKLTVSRAMNVEEIELRHKSGTIININEEGTVLIDAVNDIVNIDGNTTITGTLTVSDSTTLQDTLAVSGAQTNESTIVASDTITDSGATLATHTHTISGGSSAGKTKKPD